jgi:Tat protein translocase TatB subunit
MGPLGVPEMIFIFVLALLILGPKKLPEVGRTIGKAMAEFRRASNDLKSTFEREMNNLEREGDALKDSSGMYPQSSSSASASPTSLSGASGVPYEYPYDDYSGSHESNTPSASAPQAAENQPVVHQPVVHPSESPVVHKPEEASNGVKS